jgi:ribonuclease VapC
LSARLKSDARALLARFLSEASIAVVPFGESHYGVAVEAWLRFGKGRHPAALNFGDCLSYAVASLADEPLLFMGGDFARTDISRAPRP